MHTVQQSESHASPSPSTPRQPTTVVDEYFHHSQSEDGDNYQSPSGTGSTSSLVPRPHPYPSPSHNSTTSSTSVLITTTKDLTNKPICNKTTTTTTIAPATKNRINENERKRKSTLSTLLKPLLRKIKYKISKFLIPSSSSSPSSPSSSSSKTTKPTAAEAELPSSVSKANDLGDSQNDKRHGMEHPSSDAGGGGGGGVVRSYPSAKVRYMRLSDRDDEGKEIVKKGSQRWSGAWEEEEWGKGRAGFLMALEGSGTGDEGVERDK